MPPFKPAHALVWMLAALLVEAALLPHWVPIRWVPQISFLILLFAALKEGLWTGVWMGAALGAGQALFSALSPTGVIAVYAGLGAAAGAAKNLVFLESPLAQWIAPVVFGLMVEAVFFWMMPWDETPLGLGDYAAMIRASNLPVTWLLSGFVFVWCDRALFSRKRS